MKTIALLRLVGLVIFVTAVGVIGVLIPFALWTPAAFVSALLLVAALSGVFLSPSLGEGQSRGDAGALASIGPVAMIFSVLVPWTAASLFVALSSASQWAWAMNLIALGGFAASAIVLKAAVRVIDQVGASTANPSPRTIWIARLEGLAAGKPAGPLHNRLQVLTERMRYAASDLASQSSTLSQSITDQIDALTVSGSDSVEIEHRLQALESLLSLREAELRAARTKS